MKFITFLKEQWNLIASFSVAIVVFLTKIVVPPNVSLYAAAGDINYTLLAQFVVTASILILLFPFGIFKTRKYGKLWWSASVVSLVIGTVFFISYINLTDRKTGYNRFAHTRKVIGDHILPLAKEGVDSIKAMEKLDTVTPEQIVSLLGEPEENYPIYEIAHNSNLLAIKYALTVLFISLFVVLSIQSIYCTQKET